MGFSWLFLPARKLHIHIYTSYTQYILNICIAQDKNSIQKKGEQLLYSSTLSYSLSWYTRDNFCARKCSNGDENEQQLNNLFILSPIQWQMLWHAWKYGGCIAKNENITKIKQDVIYRYGWKWGVKMCLPY